MGDRLIMKKLISFLIPMNMHKINKFNKINKNKININNITNDNINQKINNNKDKKRGRTEINDDDDQNHQIRIYRMEMVNIDGKIQNIQYQMLHQKIIIIII